MSWESDLADRARELFPEVPWRRYVAVGDSITEGIGDPVPGYPDGGWVPTVGRILKQLRPDFEHVNLAKRGLTTREVRQTQVERAIELEPDLVTVSSGGNDLLKQRFDPSITEQELDAMFTALRATGADMLTFTMYDIFSSGVTPEEMNAVLSPRFDAVADVVRTVAARHDVYLIDFAVHPASRDPDTYSTDLQHANMRGLGVVAEEVVAGLAELARGRAAGAAEAYNAPLDKRA
jgi:lysophospholipase L1-like esterase